MNPKYRYKYELLRSYTWRLLKGQSSGTRGDWERVYRNRSYENVLAKQTELTLLGCRQWSGYATTQQFKVRIIERKKK